MKTWLTPSISRGQSVSLTSNPPPHFQWDNCWQSCDSSNDMTCSWSTVSCINELMYWTKWMYNNIHTFKLLNIHLIQPQVTFAWTFAKFLFQLTSSIIRHLCLACTCVQYLLSFKGMWEKICGLNEASWMCHYTTWRSSCWQTRLYRLFPKPNHEKKRLTDYSDTSS